jgi:hypothetical protein
MKRFAIATLAAFAMLLGTVLVAREADPATTTCPAAGTTGGNCNCVNTTISSATIAGNLTVPAGDSCTLNSDVTVDGNVRVDSGASLFIQPGPVKIGGNLLATSPGCSVLITAFAPVTIGGNVEIENCAGEAGYEVETGGNVKIGGNFTCNGASGGCFAQGGSVDGNVTEDDNPADGSTVQNIKVGGNVEANDNAVAFVTGNTIGGNLKCTGNSLVTNSGNTVQGKTNCP